MKIFGRSTLLVLGLLIHPSVHAQQWQDNSVTWLYGDGFKVQPERQVTLTAEHVSDWIWGDLFAFADYTLFQGETDDFVGNSTWYAEISPRVSISWLSGKAFSFGPVQDVFLAGTAETGEGDVESWLLGPALSFDLPGFDYFQLNFYRRWPNGREYGESWQLTPVWSITIPVAGSDFVFDGFIDWVIKTDGDYRSNFHFNPQFKYDLGKRFGWRSKQLMVGAEYSFWSNRFGIKDSPQFGTNQHAVSLLVKSHL